MTDLKTILAELHYSPEWLAHDVLNSEFWLRQYEKYQVSSDKHTEHYRYAAFQALLNTREMMDQAAINHYIDLAVTDPDRSMGDSALALLIKWHGLTEAQLARLKDHPAYDKPFLQKLLEKVILKRHGTV